MSKEKNVIGN